MEDEFEGPARADDPRWPTEERAWLMAWERREHWRVGFRKHLVRVHHTNNVDACGCGVRVPDSVLYFDASAWGGS